MSKPKTQTWHASIRLAETRDIVKFAKTELGIILMPHQIRIIDALAKGKTLFLGRRAGVNTAKKVLQAYVDQDSGYIKHFEKTHFTAVTIGGSKFVYCPAGNICSWSEGDYDNRWCHWCKKYFFDLKDAAE